MHMMPVKPERMAQLEEYAQGCGQDAAAVRDDPDFQEAVEGIRKG